MNFCSVITGVRFQKNRKVIYLQLQVGRLLSGAFVDPSSVKWQDPPSDIESNFLEFSYNSRELLLDDLFFDDAVLTGVQFYKHHKEKIYAMKIFGRKIRKPDNKFLSDKVEKVVEDDADFVEKSLENTGTTLNQPNSCFHLWQQQLQSNKDLHHIWFERRIC